SIGDYAPFMKAPHRMDLMVSSMTKEGKWNCNQQCVHCYAAGQKLAQEAELDTEAWKAIIDKCRENCIPQVTFTGGEPTMRSDLIELIDHAAWFVTRLNTNGIRLTEDYCKELFAASLDSVQITFYSSDAEVHNRLVGAPQYEQTVAGIQNALKAGLSVSVNTPLCRSNADYVKTLELLHGMGVTYVTCSGLILTGNARKEESESLQLSKDEIKKVVKDATGYCHANGMEINFTSPGWIEKEFFEECKIPVPTCGACLSNMAITPGGNVVPCQSWLSSDSLGNMQKDPWAEIWNGAECLRRREDSAKMSGICYLNTAGGENHES
nr:radical SAM protein [Lachnospiraceae bacterium]